ncbi:MAG: cadherin-like beta sandwich domain-containing protein [Anaerotruncus sp.]|nr:cadherin-like beta sandwich domain-containing protein [Anaerotruncus sp.]
MNRRRITAFCLSFMIAASCMAGLSASAIVTQEQAATLAFVKRADDEDKDTQRATVVSGGNIDVLVDIATGYAARPENNFTFDTTEQPGYQPTAKDITIENTTNKTRQLTVDAAYPAPTADPSNQQPVTVSITGNYYSQKGNGYLQEKIDGSTLTSIETTTTPKDIMQTGTLILKCLAGESFVPDEGVGIPGGSLQFTVSDATDGLAGYKGADVAAKRSLDGKQIEIELTPKKGATGGSTEIPKRTFIFTPSPGYKYYKEPDGKNYLNKDGSVWGPSISKKDPTDTSKDIQLPVTPNDVIQIDEEITITLPLPVSNSLLLTVMRPEAAARVISGMVLTDANNGPQGNQDYIRFKGDDNKDFITESFQLKSSVYQYNTNFELGWEFYSSPTEDTTVDEIIAAIEGGQKPDEAHILVIKNNKDWLDTIVNREEDDIHGFLKVTVTHKDKGGKVDGTYDQYIPVTIHGTGQPPAVTQEAEWIYTEGTGDEKDKKPLEGELPRLPKKMDVFQGGVPNYTNPTIPYRYDLNIFMGGGNGWAEKVIVDVDNPDLVEMFADGMPYTAGSDLTNPKQQPLQGDVKLQIHAKAAGSAKLTFRFFVEGPTGFVENPLYQKEVTLDITDTSPSDDATLNVLDVQDNTGLKHDYGFVPADSSKIKYEFTVPFSVSSIRFDPDLNDPKANRNIEYRVHYRDTTGAQQWVIGNGDPNPEWEIIGGMLRLGSWSSDIKLQTDTPMIIEIRTTAQNPNIQLIYELQITRKAPSTDADLTAINIYDGDDSELTNDYSKGFNPAFDPIKTDYTVEVPYKTDWLHILPQLSDPNAKVETDPKLTNRTMLGAKEYIQMSSMEPDADGLYTLKVQVTSEASSENPLAGADKVYTIKIKRADPSKESGASSLEFQDADEGKLTYTPAFKDSVTTYTMRVKYNVDKVKAAMKPKDDTISRIMAVYGQRSGRPKTINLPLDGSMSTKFIPIEYMTTTYPNDPIKIIVVSEHGYGMSDDEILAAAERWENPSALDEIDWLTVYTVSVEREPPSTDASLSDLKVNDQDNAPIKTFNFTKNEQVYNISVPYETEKVSFTPTASQEGAAITIRKEGFGSLPSKIASGETSRLYDLDYSQSNGGRNTFVIHVDAEDVKELGNAGHSMDYTVNITREAPSDDALLKKLVVTGITEDGLSPLFISKTFKYSAVVPEGSNGVVITPTANHEKATIMVNGQAVASGSASELIELIDIETTIDIVVTAQDGVTTNTYSVTFRNENLIEKNDNADLKSLKVNYGVMEPKFQPSVTDYIVAVTEDTYSVEIIPKTDEKLATFKVFAGTREIGDKKGKYAAAIQDGENTFTVEVTSSDGKVTKEYNVTVYRNEEDNMLTLEQLESEDIDYESYGDIITVMIDEYPRVGASVFNELRNYPEKTIIFQGNDYSIEMKAEDIKRIVPQKEVFDFRMSFTSPKKDDIMKLVNKSSGNSDLKNRMVMVYFEGHGSLPAPATLHLSLGGRYRNDTMYWHYHNEERERIDYYGKLRTNSQGTFTVQIDHLSTYIATLRHRIIGSELREDGSFVGEDEFLNTVGDSRKINPGTGVKG